MRSTIRLLKTNPLYTRLWLAQAVSLLGDWFNTIVLSALVAQLTGGSGLAISLLLLAKFLPPLIFSPVAGVLLDRFDRRMLLIWSDILRIGVVLGFLFVTDASLLWLLYGLTVLQSTLATVFEPGRSALTPALVRREDLVEANILGSVTWSTMLAVGGATGGLVAAVLGIQFALVFDAFTFFVSALLIYSIRPGSYQTEPHTRPETASQPAAEARSGLRDYMDGLRYAVRHPATGLALLIKFGGNIGNIDTIIIVYGTYLFVIGEAGAGSLGLLWTAFGVGAVIGPVLMDRFNDQSVRVMRRLVLIAYAVITLGWVVLGAAPLFVIAAVGIIIKAMGGSVYWTYSSVILQKSVDDAYLGRMFSLDMAGFQLATVISILVTGAALETFGDDAIRTIVYGTAVASVFPLIVWWVAVRWIERHEARVSASLLPMGAPGAD